jgi:hypothetical protein
LSKIKGYKYMALFQESYLRSLASEKLRNDGRYSAYSSESTHDSIRKSLLSEAEINFSAGRLCSFDVFLSHSYSDKELILGMKLGLEKFGYSIYVDWIEDNSMDRTNVTKENVLWIKDRIRNSKCLLYATSVNSSSSKWMPWELGFMDGFNGKVAILPISKTGATSYKGAEYLGVYPYADIEKEKNTGRMLLWITDQTNKNIYTQFNDWLNGGHLISHNG